jgi:hypothetical protein
VSYKLAGNTTPQARCPFCGYTKQDAQIHMDHHLCKQGRGKAPWDSQRDERITHDYNDRISDVDRFNEKTGGGIW